MFKVKLITEGLTDKENAKILDAAKRMEVVFNSEEFKQWVLNYSYTYSYTTGRLWWKKTHREFRYTFANTSMSNSEVYEKLMSGAEALSLVKDGEADIFLRVDRSNRRGVIGYTSPSTIWQTIYGWVIGSYGKEFISGNLAHEWCHKVGWDHSFYPTSERPHSVPYAVGNFVSGFKF